MKIGFGYDIHRLVKGRKLILGGIEISYAKGGLLGHSDGDVLLHALCDAMLGAIGEGDIGEHFPDSNPAYKDISSLKLLDKVNEIVLSKGCKIGNIDAVILAEEPKLTPYKERMKKSITDILKIEVGQANIKATTTEGIGFIGSKKAIAAYAVAFVF